MATVSSLLRRLELCRIARLPTISCQSKRFYAKTKEVPFSQSLAFSAPKSGGYHAQFSSPTPIYIADYYDSSRYQLIRALSALASVVAVVVYVAFFRDRSDIDDILEAPPALLAANVQRSALRHQIAEKLNRGESTALLQAELDYVEVREAAMRTQFKSAADEKEKK